MFIEINERDNILIYFKWIPLDLSFQYCLVGNTHSTWAKSQQQIISLLVFYFHSNKGKLDVEGGMNEYMYILIA